MITIDKRIPALPDPLPEARAAAAEVRYASYVVVPAGVLDLAIQALAAESDFAGSLEMMGRPDSDIVNPHFTAGHYRQARAARQILIEELARG